MLNKSELEAMSEMDISRVDPATLVNIRTLSIDPSLPQAEKIEQYLSQIRNPYCFLVDDTPVRIRFVHPQKPLSQALISYFSRLKSS